MFSTVPVGRETHNSGGGLAREVTVSGVLCVYISHMTIFTRADGTDGDKQKQYNNSSHCNVDS